MRLEGPEGSVTTPLLVDSGSEYTLVTRAFARRIGVEPFLDPDYSESIRMGGQTLRAVIGHAILVLPGFDPVDVVLGFVDNWQFAYAGVLGQRGFFERFGVLFDRTNLRFGLLRSEEVDAAFPPPPPEAPSPPSRLRRRSRP